MSSPTAEGTATELDNVPGWPETGRSMNVLGFDEAFQHAEEVELAGERIMVATPPWHVALKLFAYSDRAAERDLADIEFILENATEVLSERVFDELSSELADGHLQYDETGPYLLACDLRRQSSTMVIAGLLDVLSGLLDEADHLSLRRHLLGQRNRENQEAILDGIVRRFEAFRRGLRKPKH